MDKITCSFSEGENEELIAVFTPGTSSTEENEFINLMPGLLFQQKIKIVRKHEPQHPNLNENQRLIESLGIKINGYVEGKGIFIVEAQWCEVGHFARIIANFKRLSYEKKVKVHKSYSFGPKLEVTIF